MPKPARVIFRQARARRGGRRRGTAPPIAFALCLVGVSLSFPVPPRLSQEDARSATIRDPIEGWWRGSAIFRDARLELVVHFIQEGTSLEATLSIPDMM